MSCQVGTELIKGDVVAAADFGTTPSDAAELGRGGGVDGQGAGTQIVAQCLAHELGPRTVFGLLGFLELARHGWRERDGKNLGCSGLAHNTEYYLMIPIAGEASRARAVSEASGAEHR